MGRNDFEKTPQEKLMPLGAFFGTTETYSVPVYQREYAWKNPQIQDLISDLREFLNENEPYYLLGQVIAAPDEEASDESWSLVDGQQRTTTLYLLFAAIRHELKKLLSSNAPASITHPFGVMDQMLTYIPDGGQKPKPRLRVATDGDSVIRSILDSGNSYVSATSNTQKNIKSNFDALHEFVLEFSPKEDEDPTELIRLFNRLTRDVYLVRLTVPDQAQALDVFAKLNNRGLQLNSADLLKNLLFQEISDAEFEEISTFWNRATHALYQCETRRVGNMDFLMKSLLSAKLGESKSAKLVFKGWEELISKKKPIRKELADAGITKIKAFDFASDLPGHATALANLGSGRNPDGSVCPSMAGTQFFNTVQHLPVLLAGFHLNKTAYDHLVSLIEERTIAFLLAKELTQQFERLIAPWARSISRLSASATKEDVTRASKNALVDIATLMRSVRFAVNSLDYSNDSDKKRIRYVLARVCARIQSLSKGGPESLSDYLRTKPSQENPDDLGYQIEHIHPQALIDDDDSEGAWKKSLVHNLGNLTLLNPYLNGKAGANDPANKQQYMLASTTSLTKWLAEVDKASFDSLSETVAQFDFIRSLAPDTVNSWTPEAVARRKELYWNILATDMCYNLGIAVSDIPD